LDARKLGVVVHDGRERARQALVDFFETDVVVAGRTAYVRLMGPLAAPGRLMTDATFELVPYPRCSEGHVVSTFGSHHPRAGRLGEAWDFLKRLGGFEDVEGDPVLRGVEGVELPPANDDDLLLFANAAPWKAVYETERLLRLAPPAGGAAAPGEVESMLRGLVPFADLGAIGAVRRDEVDEVARRLSTLTRLVLRSYEAGFVERNSMGLARMAAYLDMVVQPRLAASDLIDADDIHALAGVGGILPSEENAAGFGALAP